MVDADEVGGPPDRSRGVGLPIAIVRGAEVIAFDDPAYERVQPGDVVVSLSGASRPA